MRADYDSQGGSVAIELEPVDHLEASDDATTPYAIVGLRQGRPVRIDIIGAADHAGEALDAIGARYGLDAEALKVAARSALEAPDREVVLQVLERTRA